MISLLIVNEQILDYFEHDVCSCQLLIKQCTFVEDIRKYINHAYMH